MSKAFLIKIIGYISVLILIFLSSKTTFFEKNDIVVILIFLVYFTIALLNRKIPENVFILIGILLTLPVIYLIKFDSINFYTYVGFIVKFLLGYIIIILYRKDFIYYFISTVYILTLLGLPLFIFEQVIPNIVHGVLGGLSSIISPILNSDQAFGEYYSILFYSTGERHFDRNAGFMWEPSAFAVVLLVALCINTSVKDKLFDKYNIVYMLGILTSLSTTAYVLAPLALSPYLYKRVKRSFFFALFILSCVLLVIPYFIQSEIIGKKIGTQLEDLEYGLDEQYLKYSTYGVSGLSRFSSIMVDYPKLSANPLLGLGVDLAETNKNSIYSDWGREYRRSNGLMLLLLKFGILFSFILFRFWYKGFYKITNSKSSSMLILILFLLLGFSNDLILSPLLFAFIPLGFVKLKNSIKS